MFLNKKWLNKGIIGISVFVYRGILSSCPKALHFTVVQYCLISRDRHDFCGCYEHCVNINKNIMEICHMNIIKNNDNDTMDQ